MPRGVSHVSPWKPSQHSQKYDWPPCLVTQLALFRHGFGLHGSVDEKNIEIIISILLFAMSLH